MTTIDRGTRGAARAIAVRRRGVPRPHHAVAAFLAALLALRLLGVLTVPLTDTTEARYAEIARLMLVSGEWITPQFAPGVPFWGKPPLHTWLSAAGMGLVGVNEAGARLPILLVACGLLWALGRWAAPMVGRDAALASVAVLAGSAAFVVSSAMVMTDLVMTAAITLSMIAFWSAARGGDRLWGWLFFAGLGVGLLAKGPVAVVLVTLPIGLWVVLGRRWGGLARLPWAGGLVLTLAIAGPWYLAAELATPGFLRYFLVGEHVERFLVPGWTGDLYGSGHARPKGTIWAYFALGALPWTILAPALLARPRALRAAFRDDGSGWRLYLLLWAMAPMALFTPAANIVPAYALPGLPGAALLAVQLWRDLRVPPRATRWAFGAAGAAALAVAAALALAPVVAPDAGIAARSMKRLAAAGEAAAPGAKLHVVGGRRFSAEFYTAGRARSVEPGALGAVLADDRTDLVAVPLSRIDRLDPGALDRLEPLGTFGREALFVHRPVGAVQ